MVLEPELMSELLVEAESETGMEATVKVIAAKFYFDELIISRIIVGIRSSGGRNRRNRS